MAYGNAFIIFVGKGSIAIHLLNWFLSNKDIGKVYMKELYLKIPDFLKVLC